MFVLKRYHLSTMHKYFPGVFYEAENVSVNMLTYCQRFSSTENLEQGNIEVDKAPQADSIEEQLAAEDGNIYF